MTWRQQARLAIYKAVDASKPCTTAELKKAIDASYPFGSREYYPYKAWLIERKTAFYELGIIEKLPDSKGRKTRKPMIGCDHVVEGQLSLFNINHED